MSLSVSIKRFVDEEAGQSLIEYSLIACVIGFVAALAMTNLGSGIAAEFNQLGSVIASTL